ncbi:hypothetical protein WAG19_30235, partial [Bacillus cereus]
VPELNSFINGIKRDFEAVLHACKYSYNNGVAGASVNKAKLIKRIMFGRNGFDTLRKKFFCENSTNMGKSLFKLAFIYSSLYHQAFE